MQEKRVCCCSGAKNLCTNSNPLLLEDGAGLMLLFWLLPWLKAEAVMALADSRGNNQNSSNRARMPRRALPFSRMERG